MSPTIAKYLASIIPVLRSWNTGYESLRQVTPHDVHSALDEVLGNPAKDRAVALRSLFRALKQERLIFRDPARGLSRSAPTTLPTPIPTDRLHGLLDRAEGPMARFVLVLVAIHALGPSTIRRALVSDLDLSRGRLIVRRRGAEPRVVYLDELTHTLALEWLRERRRRWPRPPKGPPTGQPAGRARERRPNGPPSVEQVQRKRSGWAVSA